MATQLQRAYGIAAGKDAVPKGSEAKVPKKEARSEKKGCDKGDPFPNLPRRPLGRNQET